VNSNELILNYKGKLRNDPQTLAETFNNYFTKVVEESVSKVIKHDYNQANNETSLENLVHGSYKPVNLMPVTGKEINEIKKNMKWKNSCGYDDVPARIVKIIIPLIYIGNMMLLTGTFPSRLKFTQITPVHKKGSKAENTEYRPISLLTSFAKMFKMIYNRLHQHTNRNNIIASEQYGFKENSSTELAIFYQINQILIQNNKKLVASGIFCDLTKTFDTVDRHLLITKLKHYGIVGKFGELIESFK
jgi:hypothetical protein